MYKNNVVNGASSHMYPRFGNNVCGIFKTQHIIFFNPRKLKRETEWLLHKVCICG